VVDPAEPTGPLPLAVNTGLICAFSGKALVSAEDAQVA
jgi:hypothetical protein